MEGQQPDLGRQKDIFVFVCLFLQVVPSRARLCQPAREANGGVSIDPAPSPSHNHVDCRISSSIAGQCSQEPDGRCCVAHAGGHKHWCFSRRSWENGRQRDEETGGAAVWYGVLFVAAWLETTQNTSAGVFFLARIALSTVEYGIPCAMHAIYACVVPKLKGLWFVARARMFRLDIPRALIGCFSFHTTSNETAEPAWRTL